MKYFIQRFDDCAEYQPSKMQSTLFNVVRINYFTIKKEEIAYPKYVRKLKNGLVEFVETGIDHSCHTIFEIYTGSKMLRKNIDSFALNSKYVDNDKHLNINYTRNQESILNKLKELAEAEAAIYNKVLSLKK